MNKSILETKLTQKGQIVLRKEIREKLGLKPGQILEEKVRGEEIILKPIHGIMEMKGFIMDIGKGKVTQELMKEIDEGWK